MRALVAKGSTVLLTTQYLDEADQLADRIAVMDHGKVIAEGTPSELKASVGSGALHVRLRDPEQRSDAVRVLTEALGAEVRIESDPAALSACVLDAERAPYGPVELAQAGIAVAEFSLGQPSLDEVFLALTDRDAEADPADNGSRGTTGKTGTAGTTRAVAGNGDGHGNGYVNKEAS